MKEKKLKDQIIKNDKSVGIPSKRSFIQTSANNFTLYQNSGYMNDTLDFSMKKLLQETKSGVYQTRKSKIQNLQTNDDLMFNQDSFQETRHLRRRNRNMDDEGGYSTELKKRSILSSFFNLNTKHAKFQIPQRSKEYYHKNSVNEDQKYTLNNGPKADIKGFYYLIMLMMFSPLCYIAFFIPNIIFSILFVIGKVSSKQFVRICLAYIFCMLCVLCIFNFYHYYRYKTFKRQSLLDQKQQDQLSKILKFNRKKPFNFFTSKNLMKITCLNLLSVVCILDTMFDIIFLVLVYAGGVLWMAILVCLFYIFTFCDKIYNTKRLLSLGYHQYRNRHVKNILTDPQYQIVFYSSCTSIEMHAIAEILNYNSLKSIAKMRRIVIFNGFHVGNQKLIFFIFKIIYMMIDMKNKSDLIVYSIPMNVISAGCTFGYVYYKYFDLSKRKSLREDPTNNNKKFIPGIYNSCIKFKQTQRANIDSLRELIKEIEQKRKQHNSEEMKIISNIDKLKVKLINSDLDSLDDLKKLIKEQHFLREVSFYKMKFSTQLECEFISEIINSRRNGILKVSLKDCQIKEKYVQYLVSKCKPEDSDVIASDLDLQLRVNENTDFSLIYDALKVIVRSCKIQVLFEPLYNKKEALSIMQKLRERRILGQSHQWPSALAIEFTYLKKYYDVLKASTQETPGTLFIFKDRNLQRLFEQVIVNQLPNKELDLGSIKDIFTHSYHQERFIDFLIRGFENNNQIAKLSVRLMHDFAYYEKHAYLAIKISHFLRMIRSLQPNTLAKLQLNLQGIFSRDEGTQESLYQAMTEVLEKQQLSLIELEFIDAQFDYELKPQKSFYNTLSLLTLKSLVLTNCKFLCVDAIENFFINLSESKNTLKKLEINRLNSIVSPRGFDEFLVSQTDSLEILILVKCHKNILSRKHHKRILPLITQLSNLKKLVLRKNFLNLERIKPMIKNINKETFDELIFLDLSENLLDDESIVIIQDLLGYKSYSLEQLNLSGNMINDEGLNILMNATTIQGEFMLFKELLINDMAKRNYMINNLQTINLDRLDISGSFAPGIDQNQAISGFQNMGIMRNTIQHLDISKNKFSQFQIRNLIYSYLMSSYCQLKFLNLSGQKIDEPNIDLMLKYIEETKVLQSLYLNDSCLEEMSASKIIQAWFSNYTIEGELQLQGNSLGKHLFTNILDDTVIDRSNQQNKDPHRVKKLDLSRNNIEDDSIEDMIKVLKKYHVKIHEINLSKNKIGKKALYYLRTFLENNDLRFNVIDISENCVAAVKSASILEMRSEKRESQTKVIYTADPQRVKQSGKLQIIN